ncbi:DUF6011 domain-containing protein [Kitasatospora sp. NPDC001664]
MSPGQPVGDGAGRRPPAVVRGRTVRQTGPIQSEESALIPAPAGAAAEPPVLRCRRCGRPLHDPESRILRLGPGCRGPEEGTRVVPGEQDSLPGL